jgi:hypothetical protein
MVLGKSRVSENILKGAFTPIFFEENAPLFLLFYTPGFLDTRPFFSPNFKKTFTPPKDF